jgi:hypothetical protein
MLPEQATASVSDSPEYTYLGTSHHPAAYAKLTTRCSPGYSIEKHCLPHFKPHVNRTHRALILGEYFMYLDNPELCAWSTSMNTEHPYLWKQLDGLGFAGTFQDEGEVLERGRTILEDCR